MSCGCEQESTASHIDQQQQLHEYSSKDLHTAFGFIVGLLLTLVGVKYQGSGTTLFEQNRQIVSLFIMTISLYATALVKTTLASRNDDNHQSSNSYPAIFLITGTFASELLLFILLTPLGWSLLNILALLFLAVQYGYHQIGTDRTTTELVPNSVRSLFAPFFNMPTSTPTTAGSGPNSHDVQMSNVG